jgi:hypothetical protein
MEILKLSILCLTLLLTLNAIAVWMVVDGMAELRYKQQRLLQLRDDLVDRSEALHSFLRNQQGKVLNQMTPQKEKLQQLNKQIADIHRKLKSNTLQPKARILKLVRKETK